MTEFLESNDQDLFSEIVERGRAEGIVTPEAYHEFVDSYVTEKLQVGETGDDEDLQESIANLKARWPEYEALLKE